MKNRFILSLCCLLLSVTVSVLPTFAKEGENTPYNWYFIKNDRHEQPKLETSFSFIKQYDGYYVGSSAEKVIYLTFDAGYENGNIERILNTLKKHDAKGSFFILENLIKRNPELVLRMVKEGHLVCNHTAKHPDMTKISDEKTFEKQLTALEDAFFELTGQEMAKFYRPPEGRFSERNLKLAKNLGYKTIFWSFAYADWDNTRQPNKEKSLKNILDHSHNGMILLLHPTSDTNAAILDELLTRLTQEGYRFLLLDRL